jgi:hypothetical protein
VFFASPTDDVNTDVLFKVDFKCTASFLFRVSVDLMFPWQIANDVAVITKPRIIFFMLVLLSL